MFPVSLTRVFALRRAILSSLVLFFYSQLHNSHLQNYVILNMECKEFSFVMEPEVKRNF